MFNIFKRNNKQEKKEPEPEPEVNQDLTNKISKWHKDGMVDACIIYYITASGETCVDVEIGDYNKKTLNNFYKLVSVMSEDSIYIETLEMIKEGFVEAGREDLFEELAEHIALNILKIVQEKPCLRPSDVL